MLAVQVSVSHQGSYRFKGIPGVHTVLSLSHGHLTSRCEAGPWIPECSICRLYSPKSLCLQSSTCTSVWHPGVLQGPSGGMCNAQHACCGGHFSSRHTLHPTAVPVITWQPVACSCSSGRAALPGRAASILTQPACTVVSRAPYQHDRAGSCALLNSAKCRSVTPCSAVQQFSTAPLCFVGPVSAGSACLCNAQLQKHLADKQHVLCRVFPPPLASNKKAELATSPLGLQAVIMFRAYSSQVSGTHSFSRELSGQGRESSRGTFSQQHSGQERMSSRGSFTFGHETSSPALQSGGQRAST